MTILRRIFVVSAIILLGAFALSIGLRAKADPFIDQEFSNTPAGQIVNSASDAEDADIGDGSCETATEGECTLRAAIQEVNAGFGTYISFNIPGEQVHKITLTQLLPPITRTVIINGYTQPGSVENTASAPAALNSVIKVEVDASQLGENSSGIVFSSGSAQSILRGLSVYGADSTDTEHANVVIGQSQVLVYGCYLGVKASGQEVSTRQVSGGVLVTVDATTQANIVIGGSRADQRNLIFGSTTDRTKPVGGVNVGPNGKRVKIYGNVIGIARDGHTDLGGVYGMVLLGEINEVGGPLLRRNVVSGGSYAQMIIGSKNTLISNWIGTNTDGGVESGITNGVGIAIIGSQNLVGAGAPDFGNIIKGTSGAGIVVQTNKNNGQIADPAQGNAIIGNTFGSILPASLADGQTQTDLPIDLMTSEITEQGMVFGLLGLNSQNATSTVGEPNNLLNSPVIKSATQNSNQVTVNFDLNVPDISAQSGRYRVEFYITTSTNIANAGPAEEYLDAVTVDAGTNQTATLSVQQGQTAAYRAITATATVVGGTQYNGIGSTSEFSSNRIIGGIQDTDGDTITDPEEDAGPNNGDANGDSVADKLQSNVTSFISQASQNGTRVAFIMSGCADTARADDISASALSKPDSAHGYPFGLVDYALRCTQGATARITQYVFVDDDPAKYSVRKYNYTSELFSDVPDASITKTSMFGSAVLKVEYDIKDGGPLDEDGEANSIIVDPIGLAIAGSNGLPQVGIALVYILVPLALAMLTILTYAYFDYLRHKRPLVEENPRIHYTFWHHLHVVTFPILRYKISFVIERQDMS